MAKYAITLTPRRNASVLSFTFDDTSGEIGGPDSMLIGEIIASAKRARFVPVEPHPQGYRIGPTPHSLVDLAAIFAADSAFDLPDWLDALRPRGASHDATDADAEPVY